MPYTRRLDSAFATSWNKWWTYIFLILIWYVTIRAFVTGNQNFTFMYYVLPPCSIIVLWWLSSFKRVTLDKDTLIIRGFRREAHVPVSQVERVVEHRWNKGLEHITLVFGSNTEFRRVRIMIGPGGKKFDQITKVLRAAMEGKNIGVSIKHIPRESKRITNPISDKKIIVSGWTNEELQRILADFTDMYSDQLGPDFDCEVSSHNKGSTHITFPHDIPASQFPFLINYLQYPKNHDLKARSISVVGEALLSPDFYPPSKNLAGQRAFFYIPLNDQNYDVVYVHVRDETFAKSFASNHWKKVFDPRIPPGLRIDNTNR